MLLRELFEAPKTAVFAFGRMNPPTIGHAKLADVVKSQKGDPFLFLSQTQKPKTDPLPFPEKMYFASKSFPGIEIGDPKVKTIIQAMQSLEAKGYTDIIYVAGSDRVDSFTKLLNDYNGKDYNFNSINIVSAGERDPDADGAEGMSASKMRAAAQEGDFDSFKQGVANAQMAQQMYDQVRKGMGIVDESLDEYSVKQQRPKIEVLYNIADRKDSMPFPLSYKDTGGASSGGEVLITPQEAQKFIKFYDSRAEDEQELMQKALKSVNGVKNLFNNLNINVSIKVPKNKEISTQDPYDRLKANLTKEVDVNERPSDSVPSASNSKIEQGKAQFATFQSGLNASEKKKKKPLKKGHHEGAMFPNPKNSFLTKSDTAYDFLKLGTNLANLKSMPAGSNVDEPDIMIAPYAGAKEMKYLMKQLNRIGYQTQDAQGYQDAHFDDKPTGGKAPPQLKKLGSSGKIKLDKLKSVQSERQWHKLGRQLVNVLNDDYAPLQIDRKGRIVNGHHRYDALRLTGAEYARVHMADEVLENMLDENFAEGYKLQLERDKEMLVLNITDTGTGKRTEVRGKSGYETNYDPNDKLHMLLDKIGKSANISELMNGEVVSINPKHPQGTSAKDATDVAYNENFADGKVNYTMPKLHKEWDEASRYPEFRKIGKDAWIKLASKGKAVTITSAKGISNTDATEPDSFSSLDKEKQARTLAQLKSNRVEMPIVAVYSDGHKELIGGNTRLTALMAQRGKATVWQFDVPDDVAELAENFADWRAAIGIK